MFDLPSVPLRGEASRVVFLDGALTTGTGFAAATADAKADILEYTLGRIGS